MKENLTKTKLRNGQPVLGVLSGSPDPGIAEICGLTGLDFYLIDAEHGSITTAQIPDIVRACEVSNITPLARVRSNDPKLILQFLDAGVMGIMLPGVQTVAEVEQLVKAVKYPPMGLRGLGFVRSAEYLMGSLNQGEYVQYANEQILVLPQIESREAIAVLDDMCRVEGVDGFVVGPRDLAMSMGFYDGPGYDEVKKTIAGVVETVTRAGLVVGTTATNGDQVRALVDRGVLFCLNSVSGMLRMAATDFMKRTRA